MKNIIRKFLMWILNDDFKKIEDSIFKESDDINDRVNYIESRVESIESYSSYDDYGNKISN